MMEINALCQSESVELISLDPQGDKSAIAVLSESSGQETQIPGILGIKEEGGSEIMVNPTPPYFKDMS